MEMGSSIDKEIVGSHVEQWENRSKVLHKELDKELQEEEPTLNMELVRDFRTGFLYLPQQMAFLFHSSLEDLVQIGVEYQRSGLSNVQVAHCWASRCHEKNQRGE